MHASNVSVFVSPAPLIYFSLMLPQRVLIVLAGSLRRDDQTLADLGHNTQTHAHNVTKSTFKKMEELGIQLFRERSSDFMKNTVQGGLPPQCGASGSTCGVFCFVVNNFVRPVAHMLAPNEVSATSNATWWTRHGGDPAVQYILVVCGCWVQARGRACAKTCVVTSCLSSSCVVRFWTTVRHEARLALFGRVVLCRSRFPYRDGL